MTVRSAANQSEIRLKGATSSLWLFGLLIGFLVATFPGHYMPIHPGLDPSWMYALNYLPHSPYAFGKDVFFTYGPLGYLVWPLNIETNLLHAAIFLVLTHSLFAISVCYWARRASAISVVLFCATFLIALASKLGVHSALITLSLFLSIAFEETRARWVVALCSGLFAALLLFTKLSLGVAALSLLFTCGIMQILLRKPHAGRVFALVVCVYGIGIVGLTFWYFSSFAYLWQWVRGSLEIINGYSSAMSLVGPSSFLVYALVVVMGVIYSATCLRSSEPRSFCFVMGLSACLFIAFREGFVRQDAHAAFFFPFVLALISGMLLHTTTRRGLRWNTSLFLAVFAVTGVVSRHHRVMSWQNFLRVASGQQGANNLISLFSLSKVQHALDQQSHVMLKRNLLPPDWIQTIERGNTVNVLPSEIAYLPANQLSTRWRPSPTLQSYSAYTASLDHLTARAYSNDTAPGSLLVTFHDIDARHLFWSTPATWQAILRNYTVREVSPTANLLLLQRQSAAGGWATREREQREERVGHWIDVPQSSTLLFLDLTMQLNTLGTLAKSLFRISPVYVDVLYESGRSANYRLIPDTAKNGILINYLPQSVEECAQIFRGVASDRVTTFRISGPGTKYYQPTVKLTYKESPLLVTQLPRQSPVGSENLRLVGNATRFSIDSVNDLVLPKRIVVVADHDEMIRVSGWAVDAEAGREAGGVFLSIDGKLDVPVSYGSTRADVARHFGNAQYERSGFSGTLLASRLGKGHHSLHLKIVTTDKTGYYLSPEGVTVEIQ